MGILIKKYKMRELARLQTFPDDFIFEGTMKRAYWQIGNAVPCILAKNIALALKPSIEDLQKKKNRPLVSENT